MEELTAVSKKEKKHFVLLLRVSRDVHDAQAAGFGLWRAGIHSNTTIPQELDPHCPEVRINLFRI